MTQSYKIELVLCRAFSSTHKLFAAWSGDTLLGHLELVMNDEGKPIALMGITILPKLRRKGWGTRIVEALGNVVIVDIQKEALGFWKKLGRA